MENYQLLSEDQYFRKLAETAGFSDIYKRDYSEYFTQIEDYVYLSGEKYRPQDISLIIFLNFAYQK